MSLISATGVARHEPVLDVGAGASTLVDHLLREAYTDITCLDIAPDALERSRVRLGVEAASKVTWVTADITEWRPAPASVALWHDRATFHFLTTDADRAAYVRTLTTALRPNGSAIIATFATDGPTRCSDLDVRQYDEARLLADLGPPFQLVDTVRAPHVTPWGSEQKFVWFVLRRSEERSEEGSTAS